MKTHFLSLLVAILSASPVLAQGEAPVTFQDIVKLSSEGVSEEDLIARIDRDKAVFDLKADDVILLKKLKVGEKVIQRMIAAAKAAPAGLPAAAGADANAVVKNDCWRGLFLVVDEKEKVFGVSKVSGTEFKVGQSQSWKLPEGTWTIAIDGSATIDTFEVAAGKPVTLTLNGASTEYVEVVTLVVQDRRGRLVSVIDSVGKLTESQRRRDPRIRPPERYVGMYGPKYVYLPHVSGNVLLGAGIGAIVGRRSGHTAEGAAIGAAAGLLVDHTPWAVVRWR